ncbi:SRPBCC family protein [Natronobacterium gregoryi]|uniref:Polyketide cyclase / dehydrase and lipid transport n=2 Tax=Natronobacterium gregoryi TaxID=44930 RepID=L0AND2_NATGS|nr:SRPBCC family protein [Natronobacterium gregoryi]AFZ74697.1 Polyketide cyclase / dehydrase and lipid transport [Natronobacterium gregoryi SP2]ELY73398.1 polyketide cyclase/dehydrase [Natronobacterium gregoryi SP2]PLK20942.1 SRPBCC family protein [Natronobacterium gregoryi SP2]SFJ04621.1 Polyketide cyclase / dehydrase and lipid transport [Natronobacterium gregoryi]
MREVTASRVVDADPGEVWARFDPPAIVEAEGSFTVESIEDEGEATIVVASGPGIQLPLRFEYREDTIYYTQDGKQGPFSHMETWLECEPADGGTRVTLRSSVSLSAPLPFGDRIAAWKRNGELKRALEAIESTFA